MPKSIRIRTEPGVDRNINVKIDQEFDFLEILSLKLRQEDIYTQFCADYGVVVGRVIANGGVGVPNAHISIFIPIDQVDENDPVISTLYPYKSPEGKNEDGFRYNLLPYQNEYYGHTATGTFPTDEDVLTRKEVLHVYEKYYKYSVRTNDSGDFMIVGVPLGAQKLVMDLDLSNMGEFSLRPSDLIRMGMGVPAQFDGQLFKASENIDSLPQILHDVKDIDVSSFWGQEESCDVGITRADFDLRERGIEILPHAVFMGSIISSTEEDFLKASCKPKKETGNLCSLSTGPGQILAIRQTIAVDENGDPVLEEYKLEEGGNVIDENGTWVVDLPMNLNYVTTNEFGERVTSNDPTIGIPTKSKYRFKIKWQNEGGLQADILRANYLIPNIKEHWDIDPNSNYPNQPEGKFNKSYSFSLDWNDYEDKAAAIKCEDTFYQFNFNKVYTTAAHLDRFKWGFNRQKHLGIKDILNRDCANETNKFPTNEAQRNSDFIYFLMSIVLALFYPIGILLIIVAHFLSLIAGIITFFINLLRPFINLVYRILCPAIAFLSKKVKRSDCGEPLLPEKVSNPITNLALPMLTYPDCENCNCESTPVGDGAVGTTEDPQTVEQPQVLSSDLADFNDSFAYNEIKCGDSDVEDEYFTQVYSGYDEGIPDGLDGESDPIWYKTPLYYQTNEMNNAISNRWYATDTISMAQSLNLLNQRSRYFLSNPNKITTKIINSEHGPLSYAGGRNTFDDMPLIMVCRESTDYSPGQLITFNDTNLINDPNISGQTSNQFSTDSITGAVEYNPSAYITKPIRYINSNGSIVMTNLDLQNNDVTGKTYNFKTGLEYFQVVTATTLSNVESLVGSNSILKTYIFNKDSAYKCIHDSTANKIIDKTIKEFEDYGNLKFVILTRGVDPYTPKQKIKYDLSDLFDNNNLTVEGDYYLNVPIQPNGSGSWKIDYRTPQPHYYRSSNNWASASNNDDKLFRESFLFSVKPTEFNSFDSQSLTTYSSIDKQIQSSLNGGAFAPKLNGYDGSNGSTKSSNEFEISHNGPSQGRVEGATYQYTSKEFGKKIDNHFTYYTVSTTYKNLTNTVPHTTMSNHEKLIFRSDRLPGSDNMELGLVDSYHDTQTFVFHLNDGFSIYKISDDGSQSASYDYGESSGVSDETGNFGDMTGDTNSKLAGMLSTFTCEGMVPFDCYVGDGVTFTADTNCDIKRRVENGCYTFVNPVLFVSIPRDIKNFIEWRQRYKYVFAACRNIFGHAFQNNWINGTLYMPSFQKRTFYDSQNNAKRYKFCGDPNQNAFGLFFANREYRGPLYFNTDSNSFYYRSTPYFDNGFVSQNISQTGVLKAFTDYPGRNDGQIFYPTTIMDMGPKTEFLKDLILEPEFQSYIVNRIPSTTFKDVSGILNLYIINRLTNKTFLETLLKPKIKGDSVRASFSRDGGIFNNSYDARMDGDYVQMISINSEFGVIPYIDGNYTDSIYVGKDSSGSSLMGIWFTSEDEQRRELGPGQLTIGNVTSEFSYPNSQEVPSYQWKVNVNNTWFGNQENTWATDTNDLITVKYQDENFTGATDYMKTAAGTGYGYLYNENPPGTEIPNTAGNQDNKFRVGSPFYFYFGLRRGRSAMNRFITKFVILDD